MQIFDPFDTFQIPQTHLPLRGPRDAVHEYVTCNWPSALPRREFHP